MRDREKEKCLRWRRKIEKWRERWDKVGNDRWAGIEREEERRRWEKRGRRENKKPGKCHMRNGKW